MYAVIITQSLILRHIKHTLLEHFHDTMELQSVFYYWWLSRVLSDIGENLLLSINGAGEKITFHGCLIFNYINIVI